MRAIVVKQAYRRNDRVVWILYQPVRRSVAKVSLVGCINAKRSAMLETVHLVQFLSPKNAVADQLLEQWNATNHSWEWRNLHVINLVGRRRTAGGTGAVRNVAHFLIPAFLSRAIGTPTYAQCPVGRS